MKRIALIALAGLALFATAAIAHQNGWGNGHKRGNGNCPMDYNMTQPPAQIPPDQSLNSNWKANPSYQGQTAADGDIRK